MRAILNMLIIMVLGITILGCLFKSYRMFEMLENASRYAKQQKEEKTRFQQFNHEQQARENNQIIPRQTSAIKLNMHPLGPRLKLQRLSQPFGPPLDVRKTSTVSSANYPVRVQSESGSCPPPVSSAGRQDKQPDSPVSSIMQGWADYVSTIEK